MSSSTEPLRALRTKTGLSIALALLSGCAFQDYRFADPPLNEFHRPSNRIFLAPTGLAQAVPITTMDRDLSRRFWMSAPAGDAHGTGYRFEIVVTPLTAPLLVGILRHEAIVTGIPEADASTLIGNVTRALIEDQSCFEVFVRCPSVTGDEARVDFYSVSYNNLGAAEKLVAMPISQTPKYASVVEVTRALLDKYLETGIWEESIRNVNGIGSYSRQLLCGKRIDFSLPFEVRVIPRYDLTLATARMEWGLPPAE